MKTGLHILSLFITFLTALSACSNNTSQGIVFPIPDDIKDEDRRLVDEEDYTVDYSVSDSEEFFLANGYSNRGMFNCTWSNRAGKIENGHLTLSIFKENNIYFGAEYRSRTMRFHYGYYATRMKASSCPGVISSFFTYTHYPVWDEIDIEFLGKNLSQVQFNYYTNGVGGHEYLHNLGFDASEDFHEYGFEWLPGTITWYVDGIKIYQANQNIPSHPQHLMMNLWNCVGKDDWSGTFDESKLPTTAQYEFIAYIPADTLNI